jgi:hypothetical protein
VGQQALVQSRAGPADECSHAGKLVARNAIVFAQAALAAPSL